jgi:hypothetical protein
LIKEEEDESLKLWFGKLESLTSGETEVEKLREFEFDK